MSSRTLWISWNVFRPSSLFFNRSDVDLLVEFEEEASTYDNLLALQEHLRQTLDREVDLVTLEGLSPHVRPYVEADLQWA